MKIPKEYKQAFKVLSVVLLLIVCSLLACCYEHESLENALAAPPPPPPFWKDRGEMPSPGMPHVYTAEIDGAKYIIVIKSNAVAICPATK